MASFQGPSLPRKLATNVAGSFLNIVECFLWQLMLACKPPGRISVLRRLESLEYTDHNARKRARRSAWSVQNLQPFVLVASSLRLLCVLSLK